MAVPATKLAPEERPEALQVLLDSSAMLLAASSQGAVLPGILDLAGNVLAADAYAVWRAFDDSQTWRAVALRGLSPAYRTEIKAAPEDGPSSIQAAEDVLTDPTLNRFRSVYAAEGIRSLLVVPLSLRNGQVGAIAFYWRHYHSITEREKDYASAIANLSAVALNTNELNDLNLQEKLRLSFLAEATAVLSSSLEKIRAGETIDHFETVRVTKSGERLNVSLSISPVRDENGTIIGASKTLRDITGKKRLEASLLQAEKIAAAGRMAATIAHEVNNPLEAITNLIFLAKIHADEQDSVRTFLEQAESELTRVSHIARQTLGFYRENASASSACLSELAERTMRIYGPKCKEAGISIERDLKSTRHVVLRIGEILQVISNIVANAIHAMPSGGTLSITTEDVGGPEHPGVIIAVRDNGVGITAQQLPRIFEAFFSTRVGVGTGIGLFVARQFVIGHGGKIDVETGVEPASHGTRMSVFLPVENPYTAGAESKEIA